MIRVQTEPRHQFLRVEISSPRGCASFDPGFLQSPDPTSDGSISPTLQKFAFEFVKEQLVDSSAYPILYINLIDLLHATPILSSLEHLVFLKNAPKNLAMGLLIEFVLVETAGENIPCPNYRFGRSPARSYAPRNPASPRVPRVLIPVTSPYK